MKLETALVAKYDNIFKELLLPVNNISKVISKNQM